MNMTTDRSELGSAIHNTFARQRKYRCVVCGNQYESNVPRQFCKELVNKDECGGHMRKVGSPNWNKGKS